MKKQKHEDETDMSRETTSMPAARKTTWGKPFHPFRQRIPPPVPEQREVCGEHGAGFLSRLTFQWITPLMRKGYQRPLEFNDIWTVNPDREVDKLVANLSYCLSQRREAGSRRPLVMALYDTFKKELLLGGVCQLISACVQVISPFVMRYLIAFAGSAYAAKNNDVPGPHIAEGIGLVLGLTALQITQSLCAHHSVYNGMMAGGQARSALIALVFDKATTISARAAAGASERASPKVPDGIHSSRKKGKWSFKRRVLEQGKAAHSSGQGWGNGRIVNLMSTDTNRIEQASGMLHMCWTAPIQIALSLALLIVNLGYSALAGFGFICILIPLLGRAVQSLMARRKAINKVTDQRVSLTQEAVTSVRFVKLCGWEASVLQRLEKIRTREVSKLTVLLGVRNGILAVSSTAPVFAAMLSFATYKLSGHRLDAAVVFSSLALFNSLRIPLNLLPMVTGKAADALLSLNRIQDFLDSEDRQKDVNLNTFMEPAIQLHNVTCTWEVTLALQNENSKQNSVTQKTVVEAKRSDNVQNEEQSLRSEMDEKGQLHGGRSEPQPERPFSVSDINLKIRHGELVAVIGTTGSGKSSLLGAMTGDMRKLAGLITIGSTSAVCSQTAWIQNTTVRQNICFGKPFEDDWYSSVVEACALRLDLDALPSGDLTEIGERGITISGGQKQRVSLARAIYSGADIVFMDDPLSAVDVHVGRHLMDHAICGIMKKRTRILVTHQLDILHRAEVDRIVWMRDGQIYELGTFAELSDRSVEFRDLVFSLSNIEKPKSEEQLKGAGDTDKSMVEQNQTKAKPLTAAIMSQEEKPVGSVGWNVYFAYVKAAGSLWTVPAVVMLLTMSQGANVATGLWLSWWTSNKFSFSTGTYIGGYASLGAAQATTMFAFSVTLTLLGTRASGCMLQTAVRRVLRSPMSFFDTTPVGRITNRFARDVDVMDNMLTESMRMFFFTLATIVSAFALILAYYYYFAVALVPVVAIFFLTAGFYRASARDFKRHEAVLRGVVVSRFGEAVAGVPTIRAYGAQKHFAASINACIDDMNSASFLTFANQRWLSVRLDGVSTLLLFTVGILVVTSRFSTNASTGGLVLTFILPIVQMVQLTVRLLADFENSMNSTERIHHYCTKLEQEAPSFADGVPPHWPDRGAISLQDVEMRYRADLPLVLKGLSMQIKGGERLGIIGRTGAGKTSITAALFRLTELSGGKIEIDGVDITRVGLHDLRSRLTIIPQDPVLWRGTIRDNLDPFHAHADGELWNALRDVGLVDVEQAVEAGRVSLDSTVGDEGLNFSLGQRQLLALSRALVRGSQIVVFDEATSAIDVESDRKIQRTISHQFKEKTLLCIAHRLGTIINYDRVLVVEAGNVVEHDTPIALYDQGGVFRHMCDRTGIQREHILSG